MLSKLSIPGVHLTLLIMLLMIVLALTLTVAQSYFNSSEINLLVEKAEEHDLEYELVIHNQLTNSYSFNVSKVE
ncbi:hypothetical protein [Peribacillus huizhouensis]|uniref:PP-loop superfamily ATP-utilizing enzyme n=1 Tax=Peribacillus huizhouensis TaxID=1501239 RepID=A0ABR6CW46_9BACI|nr:hypothetical protein [Peribacillus huizhouensis]MBA9028845.1 PP-loop superfamily ATP-utilizing enzyme [Peribacillus huizhouensis]